MGVLFHTFYCIFVRAFVDIAGSSFPRGNSSIFVKGDAYRAKFLYPEKAPLAYGPVHMEVGEPGKVHTISLFFLIAFT